jgi:hypothetical protein
MAAELIGLAAGVAFWIGALALFVAWLIGRARKRFLASLEDDGTQGADWGAEGVHSDNAGAAK